MKQEEMTNTNKTKSKTLEEIAWRPDCKTVMGKNPNNNYNVLVLETMDEEKEYTHKVCNCLEKLNYSGTSIYSVWNMPAAADMLKTGEISLLLFNWRSYWTGQLQRDWLDNLRNYLSNEKVSMPPTVVAGTENLEEAITKYLPLNKELKKETEK